ncbi:MAG: hypothetical protein JO051_11790 [Acidobacteriaceae bacterium]|nr:hypothetical protein [Acidobacteriaceae bacterium]
MVIVLTLYIVFTFVTLFCPLRWAIAGYLLLACVDFQGNRDSIGILNAIRGFAVPLYLLWRLRGQAGHRTIVIAPVAWALLTVYAAIGSFWSYFPTSAWKLVGQMCGSLLIAFVLARAAKGGYLTPRVVIPVSIGAILIAVSQFIYLHNWTSEESRFSAFTSAQAFAAYLAALYCVAVSAPGLAIRTRIWLCSALGLSAIFNGSRIWFIGMLLATLVAFLISDVRVYAKVFLVGAVVLFACVLVMVRGQLAQLIQDVAPSNRIVAAALAAYQGDMQSNGLGTLRFRRIIDDAAIDQLKKSTVVEFFFGRGTSNGSLITGSIFRGYAGMSDPNRMVHDEWVRVFYEWGLFGMFLWCAFWASVIAYSVQGVREDREGFAKPLLIYVPGLLVALAGENFLAGAGSAISIGFLMLFGLATLAHRNPKRKIDPLLVRTGFSTIAAEDVRPTLAPSR